jgi:uncharacterized protein YbjT (DUF2867 family)
MTETILVTGATGTVGSELVDRLADRPDVTVRAGVHSLDSAGDLPAGVEPVAIELTDPETLTAAFEGVDRAYLLTPFVAEQAPLVASLAEAADAADVDHLVRQSALGAGADDPPYSLAADHRAGERHVDATGAAVTHVRPTSFFQNLLGDSETVREEGVLYGPVTAPVSYVDARDVAAVAAAILTGDRQDHDGHAYRVTGPAAVTYREIADALAAELGRPVDHVQVSMEAAREGMSEAGMPEPVVEGYIELLSWFEAGAGTDVADTVGRLTGRSARSLDRFVADYASAFE